MTKLLIPVKWEEVRKAWEEADRGKNELGKGGV